ncbi:hypothetical protein HYALB_00002284 [Hymenoscyphus albidus]|uniref:Uncharacterized protein n=1 Tax=Hymenoscyphus albidus TaxID=595503 RepID=A0A9N9LWP5_9HELO|nr:hypothetical protein HYALB_00002284 [Hymenoscyphus albidus]
MPSIGTQPMARSVVQIHAGADDSQLRVDEARGQALALALALLGTEHVVVRREQEGKDELSSFEDLRDIVPKAFKV